MAVVEAGHLQGRGHNDSTEWKVTVPADDAAAAMARGWLFSWPAALRGWLVSFGKTAWKTGADDPRKVVHGLKMAIALNLCSAFYYVQPLYVFTGENAMWAILTVVLIFENTVGGCVYKAVNRALGTVAGGAVAIGVHWLAAKAGSEFEPYILSASLSVVAAAASFSRFIPTLKPRFEYSATIFILTFALVGISGYRVEDVASMALQRLFTVSIGAIICVATCALVFPVWAGQELQHLVARDMDKLAAAIEGCVEDFFFPESGGVAGETPAVVSERSMGYMSVLNAKASEDSLANLATWEPGHGKFGFRHPYGLYQMIGAAMRSCACCADALASCTVSETRHQTPAHIKKHLDGTCTALSRHCAAVLRVASASVASMTWPAAGRLALALGDMNTGAEELRVELRCLTVMDTIHEENNKSSVTAENEQNNADQLPSSGGARNRPRSLMEALPLFTAASLLLEICTRVEGVVHAVNVLATTAKFENSDHEDKRAGQ